MKDIKSFLSRKKDPFQMIDWERVADYRLENSVGSAKVYLDKSGEKVVMESLNGNEKFELGVYEEGEWNFRY